ncbi:DUF2812 domain-containing protein [Chakrabartyella piscis]|uniref:DUF2812 domain-containing protein n=1 Tax=Chakrabartyella piscis TaxID=2918914 RepID=UPI0029586834|nr:DUF2812 domain-containing protein [Chakrabartyella piscis]
MIKKLYPVHQFDITYLEHWFAELAEEGLFVAHLGFYFAYFTTGVPQKTTYRFIPIEKTQKLSNTWDLEEFSEHGWEFIGTHNKYFLLFQNTDAVPKELPIGDDVQQSRFQGIGKQLQKALCLSIVFRIIGLCGIAWIFLYRFHKVVLFGGYLMFYFAIITLFMAFCLLIPSNIRWMRLHKRYGADLEHLSLERQEDPFPNAFHFLQNRMYQLVTMLFAVLVPITFSFINFFDPNYADLDQIADEMPVISIVDVSGGKIPFEEKHYRITKTWFTNRQYNLEQYGGIRKTGAFEDGVLYLFYSELYSQQLAELAFDSWIRSNQGVLLTPAPSEDKFVVATDIFDQVYIYKSEDAWDEFWILDGDTIVAGIYLDSYDTNVVERLDVFAEMME